MIKQSKTHPFNLSRGVKTFLPRIMEKREIKQKIFILFLEVFIKFFLLKTNKGIQLT